MPLRNISSNKGDYFTENKKPNEKHFIENRLKSDKI